MSHRSGINIKKILALAIAGAVCLGASGCEQVSSITEDNVFTIGSKSCALSDALIILLNYQKEYDSLYGIDMWEHDYGEETSLEEYIKDLAIAQLAQVYTLDVIAGEQEIELSEDETALAAEAAAEYYSGLSEDEIEYLGIEEADAADLYEKYLLAQRVYESIMDSVDDEVSDSEARVMKAMQIVVSDSETADAALEEAGADASAFESAADSYSESSALNINIDRTTFSDETVEAAFALMEGEVSSVIEEDGQYYIFYCVSAIDEDLTDENKVTILEQRQEDAVTSVYETYAGSLSSSFDEEEWDDVSVDSGLELSGSSFLEIYDEYF